MPILLIKELAEAVNYSGSKSDKEIIKHKLSL
jgi:hypothetical protein